MMNRQKYLLISLILFLSVSCTNSSKQPKNIFKVGYAGALKNMMHKGDLSAKADLADFQGEEHFYALGAIENLKGEVLLFDSKVFNTLVKEETLVFDNTFTKKAALLVYASVNEWQDFKIPADIMSYEDLEKYIEKTAKENQINIDEPFPFLVEGTSKSFDWHVINWKDGDTEHSHEKHVNSGLHGTINDKKIEMLGFYSNSHHAIFTHHSTNMHIHFKTMDNKMAGHIDGLTLGKGMILKLPKMN